MPTDSPMTAEAIARTPSTFVTVLAWIFIVGAAGVVFISLLQALMFVFVIPWEQIRSAPRMPAEIQQVPQFVQVLFGNPIVFFALFWALAVLTLVAAVGLLRRKNWARVTFIGLMIFGICWNLGALWLQQAFFSSFPKPPATAPPGFAEQFESMAIVIKVSSAIFALGISALFAWITKRLTSRAIRAEFNAL